MQWITYKKVNVIFMGILILVSTVWESTSKDCPMGYFSCNVSDVCIEQQQICDDLFDCIDQSDEWNCDSKHHYEYWNKMFKKRPDEDSDKLIHNKKCDVDNPPRNCVCQGNKLLCENKGFSVIPLIPLGVVHLDLSSNEIQYLRQNDFRNGNLLENLVLSNCIITTIEKGSLDHLKMLKLLHLAGNRLELNENEIFRCLRHLMVLDLSFNHIRNIDEDNFLGLDQLEDLDLRGNNLSSLKVAVFRHLKQLKVLYLNNNKLIQVNAGIFKHLNHLQLLYLPHNRIHQLEPLAFQELTSLNGLFLSWNIIDELRSFTFNGLNNLSNLDLSHNRLQLFDGNTFTPFKQLEFLNLQGNPFRSLPRLLFQPLKRLTHIHFEYFHLCANALHVRVCEPKSDGISSIENLLDNWLLRISVWIVACLACFGNLFVLIGRLLIKESNQVHAFYIKSLGISDFLMGIYLFIVAIYDVHYRGRYLEFDEEWRHSWQCQFSGFLSTLSSEASVFTLTIITYDRYFSISKPLSLQRRTKTFAITCTLTLWSLALLLSAFPLLPIAYYGTEFYGNNGVCLPLHIHEPFANAWEYSAVVFIVVNFCAFAFIFYAYIKMFVIIKNSTVSLRSTQEKQDRTIALRFAFIVGTDLVCWMPIIIIKILALSGIPIQDTLYAWLAIFVLPVNSALNPILYTLTTKLFRQQILHWNFSLKSSSGNTASARNQHDSFGLSLSYVFFHRASWSKRTINQSLDSNSTSFDERRSQGEKERCQMQIGTDTTRSTQV